MLESKYGHFVPFKRRGFRIGAVARRETNTDLVVINEGTRRGEVADDEMILGYSLQDPHGEHLSCKRIVARITAKLERDDSYVKRLEIRKSELARVIARDHRHEEDVISAKFGNIRNFIDLLVRGWTNCVEHWEEFEIDLI